MRQKTTRQTNAYKLDISQTNRDGAFQCPNCRVRISPDDDSDIVYSIYETTVTDNSLDELVLYCKRCLSFIHLTGFLGSKDSRHDKH
jgi:hypothetical protein